MLALLLTEHATRSALLGGLAFSIGLVAITLARSELFTEDFLIPVSAVISRQVQLPLLLRLWAGTLVANPGWGVGIHLADQQRPAAAGAGGGQPGRSPCPARDKRPVLQPRRGDPKPPQE